MNEFFGDSSNFQQDGTGTAGETLLPAAAADASTEGIAMREQVGDAGLTVSSHTTRDVDAPSDILPGSWRSARGSQTPSLTLTQDPGSLTHVDKDGRASMVDVVDVRAPSMPSLLVPYTIPSDAHRGLHATPASSRLSLCF